MEFHNRHKYGFRFLQRFGVGYEFWNFYDWNLINPNLNPNYYYGWMQANPKRFKDLKEGLIIFISRNIDDNNWYFVGFYGRGIYLGGLIDIGVTWSQILPQQIINHFINNATPNYRRYITTELLGPKLSNVIINSGVSNNNIIKILPYKANIIGDKEYSAVFDKEGYVLIPKGSITISRAGVSYIGNYENTYINEDIININPETIKELLIKAKEKNTNLLNNSNINQNNKCEIEEIIEKIDKILELYFK